VRENLSDFLFIHSFVDQDFVNRHQLFVAGKRLNEAKMVWEYYVQSRQADAYRQMLLDSLYHPPHIEIDRKNSTGGSLYLVHHFEGKPLVREFIANTLLGIEYLWGAPIRLETSEVVSAPTEERGQEPEVQWRRMLYTMDQRKLSSAPI
jgi:stage V sporulation protein R